MKNIKSSIIIIIIVIAVIAGCSGCGKNQGVTSNSNNTNNNNTSAMGVSNTNAVSYFMLNDYCVSSQGGSVVPKGDDIYHLSGQYLLRTDINNEHNIVYETKNANTILGNLNYYQGKFYFTKRIVNTDESNSGDLEVCSIDPEGKHYKKIITGSDLLGCELIIYKDRIYLSQYGEKEVILSSYDLNGKNEHKISVGKIDDAAYDFRDSEAFVIINNKIYVPRDGFKGYVYDLNTKTKKSWSMMEKDNGDLFYFTADNRKIYYYSYANDNYYRICAYDCNSGKRNILKKDNINSTEKLKKSLLGSEPMLVFAGNGKYYIFGNMTYYDYGMSRNPWYQIRDNNEKLIMKQDYVDKIQRVAFFDDGFYIGSNESVNINFYPLSGTQSDSSSNVKTNSNSTDQSQNTVALSSNQIGVLLSLYHWPDTFKGYIDNSMFSSEETIDGEKWYNFNTNGDSTGILEYKVDGDTVTYRYVDATQSEFVSDAPTVTKTVSLEQLIKDYYNNDDKKAEVNDYVRQIEKNNKWLEEQ